DPAPAPRRAGRRRDRAPGPAPLAPHAGGGTPACGAGAQGSAQTAVAAASSHAPGPKQYNVISQRVPAGFVPQARTAPSTPGSQALACTSWAVGHGGLFMWVVTRSLGLQASPSGAGNGRPSSTLVTQIGISLLAQPFGFSTCTTWTPGESPGSIVMSI